VPLPGWLIGVAKRTFWASAGAAPKTTIAINETHRVLVFRTANSPLEKDRRRAKAEKRKKRRVSTRRAGVGQ
jgi:hypothetical protein